MFFARCRSPVALAFLVWLSGCGTQAKPEPEECDPECEDRIAVRAVRETLKLVYNLALQGKPVGPQDASTDCPFGGAARVSGEAYSVPEQGATRVSLTYELTGCRTLERDNELDENYAFMIDATVYQEGILAVQPTATTALILSSESVSLRGAVSDPPREYEALDCALQLAQSGNHLSGTLCGRTVGLDL